MGACELLPGEAGVLTRYFQLQGSEASERQTLQQQSWGKMLDPEKAGERSPCASCEREHTYHPLGLALEIKGMHRPGCLGKSNSPSAGGDG